MRRNTSRTLPRGALAAQGEVQSPRASRVLGTRARRYYWWWYGGYCYYDACALGGPYAVEQGVAQTAMAGDAAAAALGPLPVSDSGGGPGSADATAAAPLVGGDTFSGVTAPAGLVPDASVAAAAGQGVGDAGDWASGGGLDVGNVGAVGDVGYSAAHGGASCAPATCGASATCGGGCGGGGCGGGGGGCGGGGGGCGGGGGS